MIFIQLNGGLGNQLFQYALGRKLAQIRNDELLFDTNPLETPWAYREYKLDRFRVHGRKATARELRRFYFLQKTRIIRRLYAIFQRHLPYYRRKVVVEQAPIFDPDIFRVPDRVALQGYWQSEKYFRDIRPMLLDELRLIEPLNSTNKEIYETISTTNAVSLHIRRGDYVNNPVVRKVLNVLPLEYYQCAMQSLERVVTSPQYYVFSDDIPWARQHLQARNITFVDCNGTAEDYFDFALMSACKHHIIANSSFSWWAAWLSNHLDKLVFAPHPWFQPSWNSRDIVPLGWNKIQVNQQGTAPSGR